MLRNRGEIRIPSGHNVWPHELNTARTLASAGYFVEFISVRQNTKHLKTPDILIGNEKWEIKSPQTDKLSALERNLKRATKQSCNIIIDSHRMSKIHDKTIQNFLIQKYKQQKTIKKLLFINRQRKIIDISLEP